MAKLSKQNIGPKLMEALKDDVYYVTLVQSSAGLCMHAYFFNIVVNISVYVRAIDCMCNTHCFLQLRPRRSQYDKCCIDSEQ